jgi:hypothetical protein
VDVVRACALDDAGEQLASDATPLPVVDDLACELSYAISPGPLAIARHADDRPVRWVDRDESLVPDVIDVGEAGEIAVGQLALGSEETLGARPLAQSLEYPRQRVTISRLERANAHSRAVGDGNLITAAGPLAAVSLGARERCLGDVVNRTHIGKTSADAGS